MLINIAVCIFVSITMFLGVWTKRILKKNRELQAKAALQLDLDSNGLDEGFEMYNGDRQGDGFVIGLFIIFVVFTFIMLSIWPYHLYLTLLN